MDTTKTGGTSASATTAITPFTLAISEAEVADLQNRLARTRWPEPLPGPPWARGIPIEVTRRLADYWRDTFNWRTAETRFNALPQFTTIIDEVPVYFIHQPSTHEHALPLLLCHGWPGSVAEFLHIVEPLSQPERHGGDPTDAFHVVIPAIPGFPLSGRPGNAGWNAERVAGAFVTLMGRLGYKRFGVQGGDLGAIVGPAMGRQAPEHVVGVHVNAATMGFIPWETPDDETRASLSDLDRERLERLATWMTNESGYMQIQGTKPETLALGMVDSPAALLGWIAEKFESWTAPDKGIDEAVDRDHLLTNVSLYWFTASMGAAMNQYYEDRHAGQSEDGGETGGENGGGDSSVSAAPPGVPTGVAVFRNEVAIRHWGEQSNHITHWTDFDVGGHFAAMETPDLLIDDIRTFFRTVRNR